MQQSVPDRKRPALSASPLVQQQPMAQQQPAFQYQQMPENPDFSNFDFNSFPSDQNYVDPAFTDSNSYSATANVSQPQTFGSNTAPSQSTDLVRRSRNQQLAQQNGQQEQWNEGYGEMTGQEVEDEKDLEAKVAAAKRDAQGKRKQIPPFVQKLSSFLDLQRTDLIRWSDDGRSFIVLDEDEFARTLIPELFKHNNYASFVRQLNMYGFHKTVNITDGSLRQSEKARKGVKPPSMYSHPYFRRARPDLLWLIQKPATKSSGKRKREGKEGYDSDDERQYSPGPEGRPQELGVPGGHHDLTPLGRGELNAVRQEIKKLQQQQSLISRMIGQLKEQNDQFYRQATAFQQLHDRHENSINAILTFLATFYNRSLDGHAGQNLVNMFSNSGNGNNQQHQGSVVEEYNENTPEASNQVQRYNKRPQLLLTAGNQTDPSSPQPRTGSAVTEPNSARASVTPPDEVATGPSERSATASLPPQGAPAGRTTTSPTVKNDAPTPDLLNSVPENDQMLSLINNMNATSGATNDSTPAFEYSDALNNIQKANGHGPLTSQQTNDVMAILSSRQGNTASPSNALARQNGAFNLDNFKQNQDHIEELSRLSADNNSRITDLETRLGPFSPTGSITNLSTGEPSFGDGITGDPGQFDPSNLVDYDQYQGDEDLAFLDNDFQWNYDPNVPGTGDPGADMFQTGTDGNLDEHLAPQSAARGGGTIESVSSEAPSPAQWAEEAEQDPGTPNKRQRLS